MLAERIGRLDDFVHESGVVAKGMHPWIETLQMHNANSLTTILHISRTNVQHAIIAVKKVISHMIVTLKCKTINFLDLHSPSINHDHHHIVLGPKAIIRSLWPTRPMLGSQ